jgi:hypothetical protein
MKKKDEKLEENGKKLGKMSYIEYSFRTFNSP